MHQNEYEIQAQQWKTLLGKRIEKLNILFAADPKVLDQLEQLAKEKTTPALLISEAAVYGSCFGPVHHRREEELGYACHTLEEGETAWTLRQAEAFAHMLAKEEHWDLKIIRVYDRGADRVSAEMLDRIFDVLEQGTAGEVYNIPQEDLAPVETSSPLEPVLVKMDGGKAGIWKK